MIDLFFVCSLLSLNNAEQIYFRNILFSQIVPDGTIHNTNGLDSLISKDFKVEGSPSDFGPYLNPNTLVKLLQRKKISRDPDRDLAISIIEYLGVKPSGRICGVPSLGKVVMDVESGIGCCSDYTKAWIFYANYFGLQTREVNTLNHNTVEYFDRYRNQWVWIDPYNRIEILGPNKEPMNQAQMRKETLFLALEPSKLPGASSRFDAKNYDGYAPAELSVLMWRKGTNFLTVEKWDARLRAWHIPKSIRQMVLLASGIAPHWLMLTTNAIASYMRALQILLYLAAGILILINSYLLGAVIYLLMGQFGQVHHPKSTHD